MAITNLTRILESLAANITTVKDPIELTERVRGDPSRAICEPFVDQSAQLHAIVFDLRDLAFCDDLEFHTLELPKFHVASDNLSSLSSREKWLYFLRHAKSAEPRDLASRLNDEIYIEAAGVLEMIANSPQDRDLYEARLKMLRDEKSRLSSARQEGRQAGRNEGFLVGKIQLLQQLLGEPESSLDNLLQLDNTMLTNMLADLQERLRSRGV